MNDLIDYMYEHLEELREEYKIAQDINSEGNIIRIGNNINAVEDILEILKELDQ